MRGFTYSYSERQVYIYQFIKRVGATPEAVLELLYGIKTFDALIKLKKSGYVRSLELKGINFWLDRNLGYFEPEVQITKAWFIARMEEAGGKYEDEYGVSPKGNRFRLNFSSRYAFLTDEESNQKFIAEIEDLKRLPLRECLKRDRKHN